MVNLLISSSIWLKFWWKFFPGTTITIIKPWGVITNFYANNMGLSNTMRPWLEHNVGRQGLDWDWMFKFKDSHDEIKIKFRKGKEQWATIAQILWQ